MELYPDLVLLANVAEIVSARPALLCSPLEVEVRLHGNNASLEGSAIAMEKELPETVRSIIRDSRGTDVKLIMEKNLTTSDLKKNLGRLSIPKISKILADFLAQEERHNLESQGEITVPVVEPCLRISHLAFKRWWMRNLPFYVLTRGWNAVAHNKNNGLKEGDLIQLWSFRAGGSVGFAVVKA